MKRLTLETFAAEATRWRQAFHGHYYAMYSTVFEAIVTDPVLMLVPVDDHMVHRGDGVFETFKCVGGGLYNLHAHLDRAETSARMIDLKVPLSRRDLVARIVETVKAGEHRDCLLRLLISRGPGSFGVNPYDSPRGQVYIAAVHLPPPFMETHPEGACVRTSRIPAKDAFFARTKNCNYLANALMKKEAADAGADFCAAFDGADHLAEGAAESMGIVTTDRRLVFPRLDGILAGTTMMRLEELCRSDRSPDRVASVEFSDIRREDIMTAAEFLVVGTTLNVVAVREFDGAQIGDGRPGPVARHLGQLLHADIHLNPAQRLQVID
ncbi:MAG: aminotransferase class IV [Lentisphaerae bacterium]|nr:aminotransferase class IV [Lentisphaerota bacterium]